MPPRSAEASGTMHMVLGDFLFAANERACDLVAGIRMNMTCRLIKPADQVAIFVVAGSGVGVTSGLLKPTNQLSRLFVASIGMRM